MLVKAGECHITISLVNPLGNAEHTSFLMEEMVQNIFREKSFLQTDEYFVILEGTGQFMFSSERNKNKMWQNHWCHVY